MITRDGQLGHGRPGPGRRGHDLPANLLFLVRNVGRPRTAMLDRMYPICTRNALCLRTAGKRLDIVDPRRTRMTLCAGSQSPASRARRRSQRPIRRGGTFFGLLLASPSTPSSRAPSPATSRVLRCLCLRSRPPRAVAPGNERGAEPQPETARTQSRNAALRVDGASHSRRST